MKLSIPKIGLKLPALPFRKGSADPEAGAGDRPAAPSRLKSILKIAGMAVTGIAGIGGLGAVVGWLVVNGPETVAEREARRPVLTVAILADGEQPAPNSSLDAMSADTEGDGRDMTAAESPSESGEQDGTGGETPQAAAPEQMEPEGPRYELALIEETERGMLPIVAPDGRVAWKTYARPFDAAPDRPQIALIMTRMGISRSLTEAAIKVLPPEISLSFSIAADDLNDQVAMAQKAGHEVFLDVPMEPFGYPTNDPGPYTLLTSLSALDNLNRLETVLGRTAGYAGVMGVSGSQFTTDEEALTPVLSVLKERGLMYVDSAATSRTIALELAGSLQLPRAIANWRIDDSPALGDIQRRLVALERTAQRTGFALGVVPPLPLTIDLIGSWVETLPDRGLILVPVTAIADKQSLR